MTGTTFASDTSGNHDRGGRHRGGESLLHHLARSTRNLFTRCGGGIREGDERARIKMKERRMTQRMRQFGVDYMSKLLERTDQAGGGAGEGNCSYLDDEELRACVQACRDDLEKTRREIHALEAAITATRSTTEAQIRKPPPGSATPVAAQTATLAMGSVEPAAAPDPAVAEAPPAVASSGTAKL